MGVDTHIVFPPSVRMRDIANAIGILCGIKPQREMLERDAFHFSVPGVFRESVESIPECARIRIDHPDSIRQPFDVLYHFEGEYHVGDNRDISIPVHSLNPRSNPFWIAIGKRLVYHFGGAIDFQDCDDTDNDYQQPPNPLNSACDGDPWSRHQEAIFNLKPLTEADILAEAGNAAYEHDPSMFNFRILETTAEVPLLEAAPKPKATRKKKK